MRSVLLLKLPYTLFTILYARTAILCEVSDVDADVVSGQEHLGCYIAAEGRVNETLKLDFVFFRCEAEVGLSVAILRG